MNWIKSIFLKNNSDQSHNEECSEIKHSIDALKSNNISNDSNNINDLNCNSINNDNMDGQNNCTYTTESFLNEFQKYLENYYKQQNENNSSEIDKKPTISSKKLKHEPMTINDDIIVSDFSNALENGNTFKMTHEIDESIIHQDILNNINTDVKSCHQQNDDFNKENKQFYVSLDNFNDKFSTPEQYLATDDVIYNSCDILNSQEIFENTIDLEFECNNKRVNDNDIEEFIIDKNSGDVRSDNSTIIPFIDQNEVPTTKNMYGCQEMYLDIQNLKETIAIDYDEKNTTTFNIHTINDDEMSGPFNHNKTLNFSESSMGAMTDMFDAKSISINFDDNNEVYKNKYKTELEIEDLSELNYGSSTPRKEATNSINLDNITAIPLEIETKDKETKMDNKCEYIEEISIEDNDKSILNFQNSKKIAKENKITAKTDQITNNYNTLNKIKTSMSNELNMDVIIDLTDEQDEILSVSDDSDNGSYNSSDFEFINEDEAILNGLYFAEKKIGNSVFAKPNHDFPTENIMGGYFDDPVPQSRQHSIPMGHSYYELFQGRYTPYPMRGMQNKCIGPKGSVGDGYRGVGFDVPRVEPEILPFDLRREASECVNKIYNMYPVENRRRRRSTRNR